MKNILLYFLVVLFTFASNFLFAQKIAKEGIATFSFSYPDEAKFDTKLLSQRENKSLTIYFKNGKSRAEYETEKRKFIYLDDPKKKENILIRDSSAFKHTYDDIRQSIVKWEGDTTAEITNETKMIAGFKCFKANYETPAIRSPRVKKEIWFTREIAASNPDYEFKGINGFVMEYTSTDYLFPNEEPEVFTEIMTCTKVENKSVPDDYFNIPSGYQIINWSDLIKGAKVEYH